MDFLLTFRLSGGPKEIKITRSLGSEDYIKHNIYSWFVLLTKQRSWKLFQYFSVLVRYAIGTYSVAFLDKPNQYLISNILNAIFDIFYLIDFLSTLLLWTLWHRNQGDLTPQSTGLARLLWRNNDYKPRAFYFLIVDFISLLPVQYIVYFVPMPKWAVSLCHSFSFLRIYRIFFIFVEGGLEFSLSSNVILILMKFFAMAIVFTHTMTCIWYLMQDPNENTSLYAARKLIEFDDTVPEQWYLISFYFVQTSFTNVGFADITPKNDLERAVCIFIIMIGFALINGYLIGALSSVLLENARRLFNLQLRTSLMKTELIERKVPVDTSKKIMRFYSALWMTRRGAGATNEMLDELPMAIANQVYFDIFSPALKTSLLFRSCDEYSQRAISRVMTINLYMAGDVILKRSEMNSKMYYIRKGTIQIMSYQDDETEIMTFGAGTIFGQCSLLLSLPAKSEVHAATFCEIHSLSRPSLFYTLIDYPDAKEIVINVHKNLILNMLADKFESKLTNESAEVGNILKENPFHKTPLETSKLGRDDVCIITTFPYIFMPDTIFLTVWNILLCVIILGICCYYPYCAAYKRKYPEDMEALVLLGDMFYIFDIYLTFFTAVNKENILLSTGRQIGRERLRHTKVYIDIFSTLPIHYFLPQSSRFKPVVLCIRCLKIYKIPLLFGTAEYNTNELLMSILRLSKYSIYFLIGCYVMGLLYYAQACFYDKCNPSSWFAKPPVTNYSSNPVFISIYFSTMVISGTGFGDITVRCVPDMIWVTTFFFPGVLLFCYIVSEFSAHLSLAREPRLNFIQLAQRVNSFLTANKMLPSERIRVRQYLNLQWLKNKGYEFVYSHELFHDTPPHLYSEMNIQSRCKGIHNMELFKGLGDNVTSTILKSSFRITLPPHEVVIYAGEMCSTLLIIEEGYCEVTYGRDVSVKKVIGPGEDISTVELFLGMTAMSHVRTLTNCIIVKVKKSDIRRSLILNPVASRELELAIHEFKQYPIAIAFRQATPIRLHLAVRPSMQQSVFKFRYYQKQSGNKELREPFLKLGICQCVRFLLQKITILPFGKFLKRWELVRCFFAFLTAMLFPPLPYIQLQVPAFFYIGWLLDITAWIDLYFRMHVSFYNKRNILITHPLPTCTHYIKGGFAVDFLACFPFDRIMYRKVYDKNNESSASETSIDILRMLRIIQIHRIRPTLTRLGQDFLSTPNLLLVTIMQTGFVLCYITFFASVIFLLTCDYKVKKDGSYRLVYKDIDLGLFTQDKIRRYNLSTEPMTLYLLNFYWVGLTSFSIGFGDLAASTEYLMVFIVILILISYLYFNYITIVIASHFSSINLNLTLYQKRLNHLIKFLRSENIEPLLKQHIINHFEFLWKKSRGMETDLVFANFNLALKDDVMLHLYEETLRGVPAFANFDPSFFRTFSSRLKEAYYQNGASVYKEGDIISHIYIIHQGEVILIGKTEDNTQILGRSNIFGHLETGERSVAQYSAVATKNLHILLIPTMDLALLLENVNAKMGGKEIKERSTSDHENKNLLDLGNNTINEEEDDKFFKREFLGSKRIWLIHTSYKFSEIINLIYLVVAFISTSKVSYHLAFQEYHWVIVGLSIPIELLYIFKIYLGFNTGFMDDTGEFVSDLKIIRSRYLRIFGFYKDLFTILPFELLALAASPGDKIFVATCLRMTKLLRFYDIWFFFNSKADTLNVNMVLLKLGAMGMATAVIYHQCTCFWFMTVCLRADCPNSNTYNYIMNQGKCNYRYLCCIHYVNLILTETGYGDLSAQTPIEMTYILILAYIARIYTATFIGQMVSTVQKSLYARTKYAFETETLKGFLIANDVSPPLIRTILDYANDLWAYEKGYQIPELLMNAPNYLISEINFAAYGSHINDNPIFKHCNTNFRRHLINELKRTIYYPGNIIVHEGEVNGTVYFIHHGQVGFKIYDKSYGTRVFVVEKCFGLAQGIRRRLPHYHTCFARSICIILTLTIDDWDYLIDFYPQDILRLYKEVEKLRRKQLEMNITI